MNSEQQIRLIDRLAVSPTEAAQLIGVSRPTIYDLLNAERGIPSVKIGSRRVIPVDGLRRWLNERTEEGNGCP